MIIAVEGIDRTGKSTFCEALSDNTGFVNFYAPESDIVKNKDKNMYDEADKCLKLATLAELYSTDVVFDRFHMSDFVYGILNRNYDIDEATRLFKKVDEKLAKLGVVVYYFKPKTVAYSSVLEGRDLSKEYELFELFKEASSCVVVETDYDHVIQQVKRLMHKLLYV